MQLVNEDVWFGSDCALALAVLTERPVVIVLDSDRQDSTSGRSAMVYQSICIDHVEDGRGCK